MSSLASARARAATVPVSIPTLTPDFALGLALAAALSAYAFLTTGGVNLQSNTLGEILLIAAGAGAAISALLLGARRKLHGGWALALFAALSVLTALSITWSVRPDLSWLEANRTLSYLAAFAAAFVICRLFGERWPALLGAVATACTVLAGYALLVKVFPATLDGGDQIGRVSAPFGYWNATGLIAALALPACVWAGARRERSRALRALAVPAIAVNVTVIMLSFSRSALIAAVAGLALWFALVPLRLRGAAVLAAGIAGAVIPTAWALSSRAFTHDQVALPARTTAGHSFGLVLAFVLSLAAVAGLGLAFGLDRVQLSAPQRRRVGTALAALVCLIPVAGVAALAASSRGLTGEISHAVDTLTNPRTGVGDNPGRLTELGNSRPRYWREGLKIGRDALLKGVGAGGYGTASLRYSKSQRITGYAHSYVIETFADLGLLGVAVSLGLLIAWALAAARSVKAVPGHPEAERIGMLTLLAIVATFGLHSTIDWTWFIPGTAVVGLVCAGWLAARGPLRVSPARLARRRTLRGSPALGAGILGILTLSAVAAWAVWQPSRSADAYAAAVTAQAGGNAGAALADARTAAARNPLSIDPLLQLSAIYSSIGDSAAARAQLAQATDLQPQNPVSWQMLGEYDLEHHQPGAAVAELRTAHRLDLASRAITLDLSQAMKQLHR